MIVKAKVFPKSKMNLVERAMMEAEILSVVVRVTVAPERGEANKAVIKMLAKFLDVNQSSVELINGHKCRNKVFRVNNVGHEFMKKILLIG